MVYSTLARGGVDTHKTGYRRHAQGATRDDRPLLPKAPSSSLAEAARRPSRRVVKRAARAARSLRALEAPGWAEVLWRVFRLDGWTCSPSSSAPPSPGPGPPEGSSPVTTTRGGRPPRRKGPTTGGGGFGGAFPSREGTARSHRARRAGTESCAKTSRHEPRRGSAVRAAGHLGGQRTQRRRGDAAEAAWGVGRWAFMVLVRPARGGGRSTATGSWRTASWWATASPWSWPPFAPLRWCAPPSRATWAGRSSTTSRPSRSRSRSPGEATSPSPRRRCRSPAPSSCTGRAASRAPCRPRMPVRSPRVPAPPRHRARRGVRRDVPVPCPPRPAHDLDDDGRRSLEE